MRRLAGALCLIVLAACRDDGAEAVPSPVSMNADALGYYCQMNLSEHPGPKAQVHLDGLPAPIFFSQVRDAIAYRRMPEQSHMIRAVYVSDMGVAPSWESPGDNNWIAADDAYYVIGSDMVGGMEAPELVPFATEDAAAAFVAAHGGRVVTLGDVSDADVLSPVDSGTGSDAADEADFEQRLRRLSTREGG